VVTGPQVRAYFHALSIGQVDSSVPFGHNYQWSDGLKGAMNGILAKAVGGDANRKLVLKYLANTTTSTKLTQGQWYALYVLIRPVKDSAFGWVSDNPKFQIAINAILGEMVGLIHNR
jgi:hypothetical protein